MMVIMFVRWTASLLLHSITSLIVVTVAQRMKPGDAHRKKQHTNDDTLSHATSITGLEEVVTMIVNQ